MFETGLAIFLGLVFIFIKLKRRTMLRLLHENEIPAFRVGNRWRIQRKAMLEFIERDEY